MRYFKLDEENGILVVSFEPYGPGLRAGVMEGDLIVGGRIRIGTVSTSPS